MDKNSEKKMKAYKLPGSTTPELHEYEARHRTVARMAAADGMVLLKNEDGLLPIAADAKVALYGAGATATVKGGMGSGDVNSRPTVSIYDGMKNAGFEIVNEDWIEAYKDCYQKAREAWREEIWKISDNMKADGHSDPMFAAYADHAFEAPAGPMPAAVEADAAIYVIARIAGEGRDRQNRPGDYELSADELAQLREICKQQEKVIVLVNSGGLIDLSFMDELPQIKALMYIGQPGMEAGNAVADVLSGKVNPSAKLADTWAYHYEDYPNAKTFSYMDGNTSVERYEEGIYVGYRYFDTFEIPVRYCFGYGLSYTTFSLRMVLISFVNASKRNAAVRMKVEVTNTGKCAGREVVQIYASCPQKNMQKEFRRLVGFTKTDMIQPGKSQDVEIEVPIYSLASYSPKEPGWLMNSGTYLFFMGNSIDSSEFAASVELTKNILLMQTQNVCPLQQELNELPGPQERTLERRAKWHALVCKNPAIVVPTNMLMTRIHVPYGKEDSRIDPEVRETVDKLSEDQLVSLVCGEIARGGALGASGREVPGAAAQTSKAALDKNIASIVLADGPAGLRLTNMYYENKGEIKPMPIECSIEGGFLYRGDEEPEGKKRYQYCTAFPVGMQLAQSWDLKLLEKVGVAVSEELLKFGVTLWLAPGMNIHRNPLCGRNFEYYSEDPILSGRLAGAITKGVQANGKVGTTIKHYACNDQEDNRMASDSVVSERALREIYLKGFEYAVIESQPLSIMTSYNLINGVHAANSYDLCTKIARDEWGFTGVIMTDWTTTHNDPTCTAAGCMTAGNDLIMPGIDADHENIKKALADGTLTIQEVKRAVAHLLPVVWQSDKYED